ncbi:MAG: Kae1-associated serine/threonine protein kinase [Crenarchaeota archaeon]|nr:Kae1-associated serine/threonine protein kinase [Thermoproteota archaeon]
MDRVRKILISRGAEAEIYLEEWMGLLTVLKRRVAKKYRHPELDKKIRKQRTITEARIMIKARKIGINVPRILDIDLGEYSIRMEYVEGINLRDLTQKYENIDKYYEEAGEMIGKLHMAGIIHGDLALTNFIVSDRGLFLIDFGLSHEIGKIGDKRSINLLARDINVFLRNLEANFGDKSLMLFELFLRGYRKIVGEDLERSVVKEIRRIRSMARYAPRV